ncbi:DNA-binding Xre family transcriptional regulator [Amycolatopsis endophytica]|uniref:DNA-binding Xre family transcriptional regulator n=1 Tax=Amycolatopsis endophytica TaxID=860233 RepID=A0A853BCP5_9PSEU|nr:DNA-binding Xre family transcriptional regulator [Amycolatopsis endophytica]
MPIVVRLDVELAKRKMRVGECAEKGRPAPGDLVE